MPFRPDDDLKQLYREIARLIHPDLTTDDNERHRRNVLMAETNRAYAAGNRSQLFSILDQWHSSPETVTGDGTAAELVRTIRKLYQAQQRLDAIESELDELKSSDLHKLRVRVQAATAGGRDLLAEMVAHLNHEIELTRARLHILQMD